jgi:(p)ppGpp synthase/HD superfamily hydrolase
MDLIGTTISFKNFRDLESYKRKVENGKLGRVIEFDDYYVNPNDGYRAYHFIIDFNGSPIELQLKTDRMKEINILSHDAYKHKVLNKPYMLYLTTLANNADNGDEKAGEEFLELMSRKDLVKKKLTLSSHK